jgi:dTMP kinase
MANVKIDLTLFLDLPPELGFARKGGADKNDRLENEKLDFHKRVYEGYLAVAEKNKDRVVKIDSSKNVDEVFEQIVTAMKKAGVV